MHQLGVNDIQHTSNSDDFEPLSASSTELRVLVQNLTKVFPPSTRGGEETLAVNRLNLELGTNTIFGLLGHNGAGKSTTISMLTGLLSPSSGDAFVDGLSIVDSMEGFVSLLFCNNYCSYLRKFVVFVVVFLFVHKKTWYWTN